MNKWRLMARTLPFVVLVLLAKLLLIKGLGFEGLIEFGDLTTIITGGTFLLTFMLGGTITDYKESEKLPAELACTLEAIEETFRMAARTNDKPDKKINLAEMVDTLQQTTDSIVAWLKNPTQNQNQVFASLSRLADVGCGVSPAGANWAVRAAGEITALRKVVTRISVVARTNFVLYGYALFDTLTGVILVLLLIAKFKSLAAAVTLVSFLTLTFLYMGRLLRDVDNPFQYGEAGGGGSEVDQTPVLEYAARLKERVSSSEAATAAPTPAAQVVELSRAGHGAPTSP